MTCVSTGVSSDAVGGGRAGTVELVFPALDGDESGAVGLVSNWFVADGARVRIGDLLATAEGQRAVGEITAPVSGVLRQAVAAGSTVEQGSVIGVLRQD